MRILRTNFTSIGGCTPCPWRHGRATFCCQKASVVTTGTLDLFHVSRRYFSQSMNAAPSIERTLMSENVCIERNIEEERKEERIEKGSGSAPQRRGKINQNVSLGPRFAGIEESKLINGKLVAYKIKERLRDEIEKREREIHARPGLALILVGNREDSTKYVKSKKKTAEEIGMNSYIYQFEETVSNEEILEKIRELNEDKSVHGIVVQLPLPPSLNKQAILNAIHPLKDVDGFQTHNSATALAVMDLLDYKGIELEGKNAVIIGRSSLVGKPIAERLLERNATITICHSKTPLEEVRNATLKADIIVTACGVARLVKKDFIRPDCVIIDVGISKEGNSIVGDVDFENCVPLCKAITPVPGGVGPMTVCKLMDMTMDAFRKLNNLS